MKSLLTQFASIKVIIDDDIVIVVLPNSLPNEDYSHVVTTLTKFPNSKQVEVEAALLEQGRKIKARKGIVYIHIKEEEALYTKNKFKHKYQMSHATTSQCNFCA